MNFSTVVDTVTQSKTYCTFTSGIHKVDDTIILGTTERSGGWQMRKTGSGERLKKKEVVESGIRT